MCFVLILLYFTWMIGGEIRKWNLISYLLDTLHKFWYFFTFLNHGKVLQNFITHDVVHNASSVAVCRSLRYRWLTCSLRSNFKPPNDSYSTSFHPRFVINTRCRVSTRQVFEIKSGVAVLTNVSVYATATGNIRMATHSICSA